MSKYKREILQFYCQVDVLETGSTKNIIREVKIGSGSCIIKFKNRMSARNWLPEFRFIYFMNISIRNTLIYSIKSIRSNNVENVMKFIQQSRTQAVKVVSFPTLKAREQHKARVCQTTPPISAFQLSSQLKKLSRKQKHMLHHNGSRASICD